MPNENSIDEGSNLSGEPITLPFSTGDGGRARFRMRPYHGRGERIPVDYGLSFHALQRGYAPP